MDQSSKEDETPYQQMIHTDLKPVNENAPLLDRLKTSAKAGFGTFKVVLKIAAESAEWNPIVKSVLGGVAAMLEHFDAVGDANDAFEDLALKCAAIAELLQDYSAFKRLEGDLDGLRKALDIQTAFIDRKLGRRYVEQVLVGDDLRVADRAFRTIGSLLEAFSLKVNLASLESTEKIMKGVHNIEVNAILDKLRAVPEATINAQSEPSCMIGTRVNVLAELLEWATQGQQGIYWLIGMAGTGKSAIARTLSRLLRDADLLGASFFCSRSGVPELGNVQRVIPTICRHLAHHSASFRDLLAQALEAPDASGYSLEQQFSKFFLQPLTSIDPASMHTKVIVMDAMDECSDPEAVAALLRLVVINSASLPLKIFIASRPEAYIRHQLPKSSTSLQAILLLHDIERDIVKEDIRLYLSAKLKEITDSRGDISLEEGWPPVDSVAVLVNRADNLFIFAFTAYMYIRQVEFDPRERLSRLIVATSPSYATMQKPIDQIYSVILQAGLGARMEESDRHDMCNALAAIVTVRKPLCVAELASLLGVTVSRLRGALASIHSLVSVPSQDHGKPVAIYHASFADFILSSRRSNSEKWLVNACSTHQTLVTSCLAIMLKELRFNVCEIKTSHLPNNHPEQVIFKKLPGHLAYACRYWPDHWVSIENMDSVAPEAISFLQDKMLYWLEVLSVFEAVGEVLTMLTTVLDRIVITSRDHALRAIISSIIDFMTTFRPALDYSAPHLYISALPFEFGSPLFTQHRRLFQNQIKVEGNRCLCLIIFNTDTASCTFSPDGEYILSDPGDGQAWDAKSGSEVGKPMGGFSSRLVTSVAFSPDGRSIASISDDIIRDRYANPQLKRVTLMEGHDNQVTSVALSPDGARIVSGSKDMTIRVWNSRTGKQLGGPLKGHTHTVNSVAFSPDGTQIISGSKDMTIRIWDVESGKQLRGPLKGHDDSVTSVAFSPDGTQIISGSEDMSIRVWDVESGKQLGDPLGGHDGPVTSVEFSPDGSHILSHSRGMSICVWAVETEKKLGEPLEGHNHGIASVVSSMGGNRIIPDYNEISLQVWRDELRKNPHLSHIPKKSVTFSAGGRNSSVSNSVSNDRTVPVSYGTRHYFVKSVANSPSISRIISGPLDKTIPVSEATIFEDTTDPLSIEPHHATEDGWVLGENNELLFWVPESRRPGFFWPGTIAALGMQTKVIFGNVAHGESWIECFVRSS